MSLPQRETSRKRVETCFNRIWSCVTEDINKYNPSKLSGGKLDVLFPHKYKFNINSF